MKTKAAFWAPSGILIIALAGVYPAGRELAKRDLAKARQETRAQAELLESRRRELRELTEQQSALRRNREQTETLSAGIAGLEAENALLQKKTAEQKDNWQEERGRFSADIEKMRKFLREQPLAQVTLKNGAALRKVRFKALQGSLVVLEHADGIAKVPSDALPENLRTKLAPDWNPVLPAELEDPEKLMAAAAEAEAKAAAEAAKPAPAAAAAKSNAPPSTFPKVLELEGKIRALSGRIEAATAAKEEQRNLYEESSARYLAARNKGQASDENKTRDAALDRVDVLAGQIQEAKSQLLRMRGDLARLQAPAQ